MLEKLGTIVGGLVISGIILSLVLPPAFAQMRTVSVYDQWNELAEFEDVLALRDLLIQNDWAESEVELHDLDYILVLTQQLSSEFFEKVPPALALAVISVESGFRSRIESGKGDQGLMQVNPRWHSDRIARYRYDENVDLYDPRLNIMVGCDYLNYILGETDGDLVHSLMWYNGGANYAQRVWKFERTESEYATMVIQRMNAIQDIFNRRKWHERKTSCKNSI